MAYHPRQQALRSGRYSATGYYYLVTTCTHLRKPLMANWVQARQVIQAMRELDQDRWTLTQTFVVMPDHLHWLFQICDDHALSEIVKRLKGRSAKGINASLDRQGQVWQTGYHDHAIRKEEDIKQAARYIVANPLRAGLVSDIKQYPHWDAIWL